MKHQDLEDLSLSDIDGTNNIEQLISLINSGKRTKLHTKSVNLWFRKHCPSNTLIKYLYFPEELLQHENIKEIFQSFDHDKSQSLDIGELVKMFKQFNINISKTDLKELFDVIDEDKDNALNFSEFKNCTLSERGQRVFNRIMKKVRKDEEKRPLKDRNIYLPLSFSAMITYISYKSMRKDVLDQVNNRNLDVNERAGQFSNLITLQNLYKSDLKNDDNSKLKEKIMLKNTNFSNIKVEPLMKQLSNLCDFKKKSHSFINDLSNKDSSMNKKHGIAPFYGSKKSGSEDSEQNLDSLKKNIGKLQRMSRKSLIYSPICDQVHDTFKKEYKISSVNLLKQLASCEDNETDETKQKEMLFKEIEQLKNQAEAKGKLKALQLYKITPEKKRELDDNISQISNIKLEQFHKKKPSKVKSITKIMEENLKVEKKSRENQEFQSFLGCNRKYTIGTKRIKSLRVKGNNSEVKSLDFENKFDTLEKIKEINKKAFEALLPKLKEINRIHEFNNKEKNLKLPSLIPTSHYSNS